MLAAHGSRGLLGSGDGAKAGYRGQIGLRSSWAHAVAHNIEFQPGRRARHGDGRAGLGLPGGARARARHRPADRPHAVAVRPHARLAGGGVRGDPCRAPRAPTSTARSWTTSRSTTSSATGASTPGTAPGLRNHEAPFLDVGDPTPLEPGMVFTIEPGLYDPEVGGFRHSDTVVVTERRVRPPHRLPEPISRA